MARPQLNTQPLSLRPLLQPEENPLTIRYQPTMALPAAENPPRFQWLPPQIGAHRYEVEIAPVATEDATLKATETCLFSDICFPFFTPSKPLNPGVYDWRYRTNCPETGPSEWSAQRRFCVDADTAVSPADIDLEKIRAARPRLAIAPNAHRDLRRTKDSLPEWVQFQRDSVTAWMTIDIPAEPARYPDDKRVAALWRKSYITCQEMLYGIRNLAIAGVLNDDAAMIARAKDWVLTLAAWDCDGATSRSYNDEAAFRCATALAWGYDWLHDALSEAERQQVKTALIARGRDVARHVQQSSRIDSFPYDSHAVRAVSAVMLPVGLALAGEDDEGDGWLDFATSYLTGPFSAWGDGAGGWAEGIHYWTTAMCYALEALVVLRNVSGLDLFQRPFFRKTGAFPLYCRPAWTKRATFGDDSTLGDAPSPKIARNMRLLALATQTAEFAGYADQIEQTSTSDHKAYYNYGWWDFAFDDVLAAASFGRMTGRPAPAEPSMKVFPDVGWASLQTRMDDPAAQIHCVFKSSPFGAISHSHADQNAFCLSAFGEDLLVQSGHYVAHNSSMHRNWRRQTLSKNALLIDGQGQYGGDDKLLAKTASGAILGHGQGAGHRWVVGDATAAYRSLTPSITRVQRHMHMVFGASVIVVDFVEAETPVSLTWLGHTFGALRLGELAATVQGDKADLGVEVIYSAAPLSDMRSVEGFDNVDPSDYDGLPISRRIEIALEAKTSHVMATMLSPIQKGGAPQVHCFVDDQGFGKTLYCLHKDRPPVRIPLRLY
ncbi:MAG: DUF4962 domain-containing protein [Thalassovita sp.]